MNREKLKTALKNSLKHLLGYYLLTCVVASILPMAIFSILLGKLDGIFFSVVTLPFAFPVALFYTILPYSVSMLLIKFAFKTDSRIAYAIMGVTCSLGIIISEVKSVQKLIDDYKLALAFIISGVLCGLFYRWLEHGKNNTAEERNSKLGNIIARTVVLIFLMAMFVSAIFG